MVTVTSNLGVEISKKKCFEKMANDLLAVNISGSTAVGARWKAEKKYFLLEDTTIYPKSLVIYLKSSYYLDEVWLTTYHTSP